MTEGAKDTPLFLPMIDVELYRLCIDTAEQATLIKLLNNDSSFIVFLEGMVVHRTGRWNYLCQFDRSSASLSRAQQRCIGDS